MVYTKEEKFMGKKWRQLKYEDRLKIYAWLQDKIPIATIAKRLGVCRQTIYREIKRGEFVKRNTDYTESTVYTLTLQKNAVKRI